jgi:threonine dehydrogenase-like Zn-dependent dehydrogenase
MKAVVFRGIGDIRLEDVADPTIQQPNDAIVRLTTSAICGTDLHMVRGTFPGMRPGTILGHEGVGIVEQVGPDVRNMQPGDRVVIPSTIGCGSCSYCRAGYFSQCDVANPNGPQAGSAFYGGPKESGPFDGMQAGKVRVPFANVNLVKLPPDVTDDQAILLSDILPTAWFGATLAEIDPGDVVIVFGCGPVGQLTIASALHMRAGRVLAVDTIDTRLELARAQGAEVIDFGSEDPVGAIRRLTGGVGADCAIEAVGVDANMAPTTDAQQGQQFARQMLQVAPEQHPSDGNWHPGDAPGQALQWAVQSVAKAGTLAIIGVYPPTMQSFPIGQAMNKNLTIQMGNCNHRAYIPLLIDLIQSGAMDPSKILSHYERMTDAIEAYKAFDTRQPGWIKVELATPSGALAR